MRGTVACCGRCQTARRSRTRRSRTYLLGRQELARSGATLCEPLAQCGARVIVATAAPDLVPVGCSAEIYDKARPWGELMRLIERAAHKPVPH